MKKRLALFLGSVGLIIAGIVAFLAFESYTLDINAHLEPVLEVSPHGDVDMGTVYPETGWATALSVGLSNSAKDDPNLISANYRIVCTAEPGALKDALSLCPYTTLIRQPSGAVLTCPQPPALVLPCRYVKTRAIDHSTQPHAYEVRIRFPDCIGAHQKEPGVAEVDCNLDPATQKFLGVDLEEVISIQVINIFQDIKCITKKDGTELPDCVKRS